MSINSLLGRLKKSITLGRGPTPSRGVWVRQWSWAAGSTNRYCEPRPFKTVWCVGVCGILGLESMERLSLGCQNTCFLQSKYHHSVFSCFNGKLVWAWCSVLRILECVAFCYILRPVSGSLHFTNAKGKKIALLQLQLVTMSFSLRAASQVKPNLSYHPN